MAAQYEYLLPVFVGHPFTAPHTAELRRAVSAACAQLNASQPAAGKRYHWEPRFLDGVDTSRQTTVFENVRQEIEESALTLFDLSDQSTVNVFFEMGLAVGLGRACHLLCRGAYRPPADLRAVVRHSYDTEDELRAKLVSALHDRLIELRRQSRAQDVLDLKIQIDAVWDQWMGQAERGLSFFGGDLSWVDARKDDLVAAVDRGVSVRVFCLESATDLPRVRNRLTTLTELGAAVKLMHDSADPRVRGLIVDPDHNPEARCQIMTVEKSKRRDVIYNHEREGLTTGESKDRYRGVVYRGDSHLRQTTALVRLFNLLWAQAPAIPRPGGV
jgi:hypothetical protein